MFTDYFCRKPIDIPLFISIGDAVTETNSHFLKLTGYEREDVLGKKVFEVWQNLMRVSIDESMLRQSKECDCYIFDAGCNVKEVTARLYNTSESEESIYTFVQKHNPVLESNFPFLEYVNSCSDTGIALYSVPDFVLLKANKNHFKYLGKIFRTREEMFGKRIEDAIPDWHNNDLYNIFKNAVMTGRPTTEEEYVLDLQGIGKFWLKCALVPIFEEDKVKYLLLLHDDITEKVIKRKQMEDVIRLKDEFIYFITHEFKTPLTVINAAIQSLEYMYMKQVPEKAAALVERIKQNTYRQLRLVNNLLDITRMNAGKIKLKERSVDIVFLTRAITESVAEYAQQKGVKLTFKSDLEKRVIGIDDEKYERVLLNLLSNAIKFTNPGKKVEVELSGKLHNRKRMIRIRVKDEGIGIPKCKQEMIFNRFEQVDSLLPRQFEGSGIGLSLVKHVVNALNGEISVESEEGNGSVFTLFIPSKKAKENAEEKIPDVSDSRLVQSIVAEFSDIYV